MTRRPPLILDRTPARELLVERVQDAMRRLEAKGYKPPFRSIYLSDADAKAAGLGKLAAARALGDPPRCMGLPIYRAANGRNRLYTRQGCATSFRGLAAVAVEVAAMTQERTTP